MQPVHVLALLSFAAHVIASAPTSAGTPWYPQIEMKELIRWAEPVLRCKFDFSQQALTEASEWKVTPQNK